MKGYNTYYIKTNSDISLKVQCLCACVCVSRQPTLILSPCTAWEKSWYIAKVCVCVCVCVYPPSGLRHVWLGVLKKDSTARQKMNSSLRCACAEAVLFIWIHPVRVCVCVSVIHMNTSLHLCRRWCNEIHTWFLQQNTTVSSVGPFNYVILRFTLSFFFFLFTSL